MTLKAGKNFRTFGWVVVSVFMFSTTAEEVKMVLLHAESQNLGKIYHETRMPASHGDELEERGFLGQDPWNNPYEFRWQTGLQERTLIFVSGGPDGVIESDLSRSPFFSGDDYGVRLSLEPKKSQPNP